MTIAALSRARATRRIIDEMAEGIVGTPPVVDLQRRHEEITRAKTAENEAWQMLSGYVEAHSDVYGLWPKPPTP